MGSLGSSFSSFDSLLRLTRAFPSLRSGAWQSLSCLMKNDSSLRWFCVDQMIDDTDDHSSPAVVFSDEEQSMDAEAIYCWLCITIYIDVHSASCLVIFFLLQGPFVEPLYFVSVTYLLHAQLRLQCHTSP